MKQSLKPYLLYLAKYLGVFALARWLTRDGIMIIGWHGVSTADEEHLRFPSLYLSPESFRERLKWLTSKYHVITLEEAYRQLSQGRIERPRQLVLTFDDGCVNYESVALPILREFGLSSTNFIVSRQSAEQYPSVTLLLRDVVARSNVRNAQAFWIDGQPEFDLSSVASKRKFARMALDYNASLPDSIDDRIEFARKVAANIGEDADAIIANRIWHKLNVEQLKSLCGDDVSFQVHTHTHANVVENPETVEEEARTCREFLENITGRPATFFCYPSGRWERRAWEPLRKAGIICAVTGQQGPNYPQTPILSLRRVVNGEDRSLIELEFEMSNIKWLLKSLRDRRHVYDPPQKLAAEKGKQIV